MKEISNIKFTKADYELLESYKSVLDGMADYWGEGYEFVLHSLHDLEHSVVKIINGHHTGRKIGSPITDLALSMLKEIEKHPHQSFISYFNTNKMNEPLKAATIAIRGKGNRVIGLLCINFYLNTPLNQFFGKFVPQTFTNESDLKLEAENFSNDLEELIEQSVHRIQAEVNSDSSITYLNRNKEIVIRLYKLGIFNIKDAVITVAQLLGISRNTVYMHMRNIQAKE